MTWQALDLAPCDLGESPFWHPLEQRLYWLDIVARTLHRFSPATGEAQAWPMQTEPGCMAPTTTGGLVIALRDGVYAAPRWGGELRQVAAAQHDTATHRFNDGKADPTGRFWASTINEVRHPASAQLFALEMAAGTDSGTLVVKAEGATVGNGLAWSPDARTLYWGDTTSHTVRAWDWQAPRNQLSGERVFKQWPGKPAAWDAAAVQRPAYAGRPDGAAVDVQGNYYVAMYEGACVLKLSPAGAVLDSMALPAQCPTMPCFGGDDLRTLYVTTARQKRPAHELSRYPDSGKVFAMRLDIPGLPVNFCRLPT